MGDGEGGWSKRKGLKNDTRQYPGYFFEARDDVLTLLTHGYHAIGIFLFSSNDPSESWKPFLHDGSDLGFMASC